jgi:hypothetical protein
MPHRQSMREASIVKTKNSLAQPHPAILEIRRILIAQAKLGKPMTYLHLVSEIRSIDLIPNSKRLETWLTSISMEEHAARRGLLSAVVVRKHSPNKGIPGKRFFTGLAPMSNCRKADWPKCWERAVNKVFRYWRAHRSSTH